MSRNLFILSRIILAIFWFSSLIMMLGTLERLDLYSLVSLLLFIGASYITRQAI